MSQELPASPARSSDNAANRARARDPYFDNAKAILIVLVVVGHAIERIDRGSADTLYTWIYLFHMPAFVLVSGYLSRSFSGTPRQVASLISLLLAPYFLFQTVLALENWAFNGNDFALQLFVPTFSLWYLVALLAWRLAIPLVRVMRHPMIFSIAVSVLSVLGGGISQELSGARILSFLPFFTLGLMLTPQKIEAFTRLTSSLWVRAGIASLLVATLPVVYLGRDVIDRRWLYMYGQVEKFGLSEAENVLVRVMVLVVALAMTVAVLALVPRRRSAITVLGERTLEVYLLHTIILYPLFPLIASWPGWSWASVAVMVVAAVLLTFALSSPLAMKATRWLTHPLDAVRWGQSVFGRRPLP
ncbi:acyltransferase family protein [Salinibacterium sp. UTAS2018]|uniref:acyltransferase family protein n=1 Tax=Salinibacterium sp. UTAS2018 TaxID=2508880 RepID=UPI00143D0F49|nr:acyltransferase family protein [Salinibacterium sp. UTAS2018]